MSVHVDDRRARLGAGQILWGLETPHGMMGLAWDWLELVKGVVVIADPMSIVCNATILDEEGCPLSDAERVMCLNTAVYQMTWQPTVVSAKRRLREEAVA